MDTNNSSITYATGSGSATASAAKSAYNDVKDAAARVAASMRSDLNALKNELDGLVNRAPGMSDDELSAAYVQLMAKFSSMRHAARGMAAQATRQINRGVETTTEYVKEKPMQSVAVAVGTGLLLGMLLRRR